MPGFSNPLAEPSEPSSPGASRRSLERFGEEHAPTFGWLKEGQARQREKEDREKLHWKYDCDLKQLRDLGQIKFSWAFVFKLGVKDDGPKTDKSVPGGDSDAAPQDGERIPLEAWQLANRLWELDFHIEHEFTLLYDMLILLVGLPYKKLCEEANDQKIKMRLCKTKGMAEYMEEMTELYAVGDPETGSPFTSAMRQTLSFTRMKNFIEIDKRAKSRQDKFDNLKQLQRKVKRKQHIYGRELKELMRHWGCHRPNAGATFSDTLLQVARNILEDPWMLIAHRDELTPEQIEDRIIAYEDVEKCLGELEELGEEQLLHEHFTGSFDTFFALHDKKVLADLTERWGSFAFLSPRTFFFGAAPKFPREGMDPEYTQYSLSKKERRLGARSGALSVYHPENEARKQFGWCTFPLWQPIDEVRDYFGDVVGLYFAWMEVYTSALRWPAVFGGISLVSQFLIMSNPSLVGITDRAGTVDDNPLTMAYTTFFALWSIMFLTTWKRRENELRFLWGSEGYENKEEPLPLFEGEHVVNRETNRDEVVYPRNYKRAMMRTFSTFISFVFIGITIACAVGATLIKDWNQLTPAEAEEATLWQKNRFKFYSSMANLLIIVVFGSIYQAMAVKLTNRENHRTKTEYEDALITKNFGFQFVNNYFVLFYISVIRPFAAECSDGSDGSGASDTATRICTQSDLPELQFQLLVVFTGKTLGWRIGELAKPKVKQWWEEWRKVRKLKKENTGVMDAAGDVVGGALHSTTDAVKHTMHGVESLVSDGLDVIEDAVHAADDAILKALGLDDRDRTELDLSATQIQRHERGRQARKRSPTRAAADGDLGLSARVQGGEEADGGALMRTKTATEIKKDLEARAASDNFVEDEYMLEPFESSFDEFNEMAVQYGYLALFAPAYPLAPLLALINNVVEIRIDAVKFCTIHQRPQFRNCEDIGAWYDVLNILGFLAVITNAMMLMFVGSQMGDWVGEETDGVNELIGGPDAVCPDLREGEPVTPGCAGVRVRLFSTQLWVFAVVFEHSVMLLRIFIMKANPTDPEWVEDDKDVLNYRVSQWKDKIDELEDSGRTMNEIHDAMNESAPREHLAME